MDSSPRISRRKMVKKSALGALGIGVIFSGWEVFSIYKTPDFSQLSNKTKLIDALTETIIPRTDTPGASDAEVYRFVIYNLENNIPKKSQNAFLEALDEIQEKAQSKFNKKFEDCSLEERSEILQPLSEGGNRLSGLAGKIQNKILGEPFFSVLKRLTIQGYCTSELGATQSFAYDPLPVEYHSCIPLKENQKSWATR